MARMDSNAISKAIIGAAMRVHTELGPGLLESAYRACLTHELRLSGFKVEPELRLPIEYRGLRLDAGYRIDLLVENLVVVELKVVKKLRAVHKAQLLAYLKLSRRQVGLLINFHVAHLRHGITRMVNNYKPD